jgi:hypothetical protein
MKIPNAGRAFVDREKLREYCLNREHQRGRHKARVFASALGLTADDVEQLRDALLVAAQSDNAVATLRDEFGQGYVIDFTMTTTFRRANIRSTWIVPVWCRVSYDERCWLAAKIPLLQTVALLEDMPEHSLTRGQVGTVVEDLAPGVYEVEFSDNDGRTYAMLALRADQLMELRFTPDQAA